MKTIPLKQQLFKIPVVFIGFFTLNILLMTWDLSLRQSYSNYLLLILAGCFFMLPPLFMFHIFYKLLKKLQEDKKHYRRFIIRNTKKSLVFYLVFSIAGYVVVGYLSCGLVITATITATGIWLSTAVFSILNWVLLKPYTEKLEADIDIPESVEINPANGAAMIGNSDVYGNPSGFDYRQWDDD